MEALKKFSPQAIIHCCSSSEVFGRVSKEFIPKLKFLAGADYWTAFIPTNAAMEQARLDGIIPTYVKISELSTEGKDSLENFALYHLTFAILYLPWKYII